MADIRGELGCSLDVHYLGSSTFSRMSTGLGMLQKPLRDLYFSYQTPQGPRVLEQRRLILTSKGMVISKSSNDNSFFPMTSIVFWDSVQFITVRGQDKKYRCAFEPLDNDHSRNKDNLFVDLDKKLEAYLTKVTPHPALFTCVLRRTTGPKALDLHTFVCASQTQALLIVQCLNAIQEGRSLDDVQQSGVFGYNPFGRNVNFGGDNRPAGVKPMVTVAAAGGAQIVQELRNQEKTRSSRLDDQNEHRGGARSMRQSAGLSLSVIDLSSTDRDLPISPSPRYSDPRRPSLLYMNLDDERLVNRQPQPVMRAVERRSSVDDRLRSFYEGENDPLPEQRRIGNEERQSSEAARNRVARSKTVHQPQTNEDELLRQQLAAAVQLRSPRTSRQEEAQVNIPPARQREIQTRNAYGILSEMKSGEPQAPVRVKNHADRPRTDYKITPNEPTESFFFGFPESNISSRQTRQNVTPIQEQVQPRIMQSAGQPKMTPSVISLTPEVQSKPVAMVQPRKIQGIQVLPNPASVINIQPKLYVVRRPENDDGVSRPTKSSPASLSEARLKPIKPVSYSPSPEIKDSTPNVKVPPSAKPTKKTRRPDETVADKTTDQQRLNRMKKDAEMASVASDMRHDFVPEVNTLSARGTNFEDALGYFP